MDKNLAFVLIHSPLAGPLTWKLVADQMQSRGLEVHVPVLQDSPDSKEPFWKQHAQSVVRAPIRVFKDRSITLVAHSGAGPLLPVIRESLENPVRTYVFVDAGIPRNGASRLALMRSEDPEWAAEFQAELERGGSFPNWSFEDLQEVLPDETLRRQMVAEIRSRGLEFFTEPIPVFDGWPDAACVYIQFSPAYARPAARARAAGWPTYRLDAGHFHMLVDPPAVTERIVRAVEMTGRSAGWPG